MSGEAITRSRAAGARLWYLHEAVGGAGPMVGALRKLAQKNLSNLPPHPWFSGFYYSHPALLEREQALGEGESFKTQPPTSREVPSSKL